MPELVIGRALLRVLEAIVGNRDRLEPRLSLGIAWLVIVASEMLTGSPGVGGFLWQEYNSLIYEHLILCIVTIGLVGFLLDRLMGVMERSLFAKV